MAKYAYRDNERKNIIYSIDAVKEDRDKAFFCPNPNCEACLFVCAIDGSRNAYFSATKANYPHILNCPFGSNNVEFDENQFDQTQFMFDEAMDNLNAITTTPKKRKRPGEYNTGEVKKHPPRTLRQIYSMCKSYPVIDTYGNKEIGEMILDDRSEYRYPKGCFGNKIIEAVVKRRFYDNEKKQIYLAAPIYSQKYSFILCFLDDDTYRVIRDEIYNNKDKIIAVAGKWEKSEIHDYFISRINGRKQVTVIKK